MTPEDEIEFLIKEPLPPPAEKHLRRERLYELFIETHPDMDPRDRDLAARQFAVKHCPQNVFSYPMHLREKVMPLVPNYLKDYVEQLKRRGLKIPGS